MKYVEFSRFNKRGDVEKLGRIVWENGELRVEGNPVLLVILKEELHDLRPGQDKSRLVTAKDGPTFLKVLPYAYYGGYLHASKVLEEMEA